jgi:hypothetical protein
MNGTQMPSFLTFPTFFQVLLSNGPLCADYSETSLNEHLAYRVFRISTNFFLTKCLAYVRDFIYSFTTSLKCSWHNISSYFCLKISKQLLPFRLSCNSGKLWKRMYVSDMMQFQETSSRLHWSAYYHWIEASSKMLN